MAHAELQADRRHAVITSVPALTLPTSFLLLQSAMLRSSLSFFPLLYTSEGQGLDPTPFLLCMFLLTSRSSKQSLCYRPLPSLAFHPGAPDTPIQLHHHHQPHLEELKLTMSQIHLSYSPYTGSSFCAPFSEQRTDIHLITQARL